MGIYDEFPRRFLQFDSSMFSIQLPFDLFSVDPEHAPADIQLELAELQCDGRLKQHHERHKLNEFYPAFLPQAIYSSVYKHALGMMRLFCSTCLREQFSSKMKHTKNNYPNALAIQIST